MSNTASLIQSLAAWALAGMLIFSFWLSAGLLCAPVWAIVCVVGRCIGAFDSWREAGRVFMDMVMIRWFWEAQP